MTLYVLWKFIVRKLSNFSLLCTIVHLVIVTQHDIITLVLHVAGVHIANKCSYIVIIVFFTVIFYETCNYYNCNNDLIIL